MVTYSSLVSFVQGYQGSALDLAKIIVAWEWAALLPGKAIAVRPRSPEDVVTLLAGSCGWHDQLLQDLLSKAGVECRRVAFKDVVFQNNHTATEVKIEGQWMFFDSLFGIYFEGPRGGLPLSLAEARSLWPNVIVKQCSLMGWQGSRIAPETISPMAYNELEGSILYRPTAYSPTGLSAGGDIDSLYMGYAASYPPATVNVGDRDWRIAKDTADRFDWMQKYTSRDAAGKVDTRVTVFDGPSMNNVLF